MSHLCRLRKCRSPGGPVPLWRCGECEGLPPEHSHNKDNKNLIKCHHQVSTFTFLLSDPSVLSWYQSIKATIHFDISICNQVDSPNVFLLIYYLTWQRKLTDSPGFRVWFNIVFCIWGGPQVSTEILKDDNKLDYCLRCISRNVPEGWFSGTVHILLTGELEN